MPDRWLDMVLAHLGDANGMGQSKGKGKGKAKKKGRNEDRRYSQENLEAAMERGAAGYAEVLGDWWTDRVCDEAHQRAFDHIAAWLRSALPRLPQSILDYACGTGHLMHHLRAIFPRAHLVGYDGSETLLAQAGDLCGHDANAEFVQTWLPDLADARPAVDCSIVCFPHLLMSEGDVALGAYKRRYPRELAAARVLATAMRDAEHWDDDEDEEWRVEHTLFERMCARHCWNLTKPGGHNVRVGYSYSTLGETDLTWLAYTRFTEGWDDHFFGICVQPLFRLVDHCFVPSPVIEDVHEQTGEVDEGGGYTICLLERLSP